MSSGSASGADRERGSVSGQGSDSGQGSVSGPGSVSGRGSVSGQSSAFGPGAVSGPAPAAGRAPGFEQLTEGAAQVLAVLVARGETLAVAESLTGGLAAAELTAVPGASRVFRGSVTAYATELKRDILGVAPDLLRERGAVDAGVARQMAEGVRRVLGADWGISTTGVAGPEPQDGQPVGTVFVAVAGPGGAGKVAALWLNGSRSDIRRESVRGVFELLAGELAQPVSGPAGEPLGEQAAYARAQDTEHDGGT